MTTRSLIENEAIQICQDLIRIPSVNFGDGKGDEKAVAQYVVKSLAEAGIESTIYESAPGRCNVMARIKGSELMKLSAMETSYPAARSSVTV